MSYLPEPPLKMNRLNIGGIVFKSLGTICIIVAIILKDVPCKDPELYDDYEYANSYCDASLAIGAVAVIADIIATPLTFAGGSSYMKQRHSSGIKGLMIASWVIYALQILCGIGLIATGFVAIGVGADVPTGSIISYIFLAIVGWSFMLAHAERARRSPPIFDPTASPPQVASGSSTVHPTIPIASIVASATQALPAGWEEATANDGKKYYYNVTTDQTSYHRPPPQNPAVSGPPTYYPETSGVRGGGNNSSVGNGPANISTTVSVTTSPNASAVSSSV